LRGARRDFGAGEALHRLAQGVHVIAKGESAHRDSGV
jgi:hypothetical protein